MLAHSKLQPIILTSRLEESERFYSSLLGLSIKDRSDGALVYDVGGGDLRVSPVPETKPTEHTVLGFSVMDVKSIVTSLSTKGIMFERFEGFPHGPEGILLTPDDSRVAWFRDPDGNLLSVVQYPKVR